MKKGKKLIIITIGIVCMILTAVIFVQFKTINQTDITSLENMREEDLRQEITNVKVKHEEAAKKLREINEMIAEYQEVIESGRQASETLAKELKQLNDLVGKNEAIGERSSYNIDRWKE